MKIERSLTNDVFEWLPNELEVGSYHSWIVSKENFPDGFGNYCRR